MYVPVGDDRNDVGRVLRVVQKEGSTHVGVVEVGWMRDGCGKGFAFTSDLSDYAAEVEKQERKSRAMRRVLDRARAVVWS